jgi:hypothetical protein
MEITIPNPKRIAAGKLNRLQRGTITEEGRERLRQNALKNKPWLHSTGPRTQAGKKRSADNGRWRQQQLLSNRQLKRDLQNLSTLFHILQSVEKETFSETIWVGLIASFNSLLNPVI